jgi:hypothetical protein
MDMRRWRERVLRLGEMVREDGTGTADITDLDRPMSLNII